MVTRVFSKQVPVLKLAPSPLPPLEEAPARRSGAIAWPTRASLIEIFGSDEMVNRALASLIEEAREDDAWLDLAQAPRRCALAGGAIAPFGGQHGLCRRSRPGALRRAVDCAGPGRWCGGEYAAVASLPAQLAGVHCLSEPLMSPPDSKVCRRLLPCVGGFGCR